MWAEKVVVGGGERTSMGYAKTGVDAAAEHHRIASIIHRHARRSFLVQHERRGRDGGGGGFATAVWGGGSLGSINSLANHDFLWLACLRVV